MQDNWLTALPDYAVVEATAADTPPLRIRDVEPVNAQGFLQNQFCNDVAAIDAGVTAQINGFCNPKGRLLALFHLIASTDTDTARTFRMVLPASVANGFVKRLSMFLLGADAKISLQPQLQVWAMAGLQAAEALDGLPGSQTSAASLEPYQSVAADHLQVVRLPADRWLIIAEADGAAAIQKSLADVATPVDSQHWVAAAIAQGEPAITAETAEKFIPQMLNMQSIDGLSFKKGCYPGQEIVARMQYLGKLKRNMRRIGFAADAAPLAGATIKTADDADLGTLVSVSAAAAESAGRFEALAVLKADADLSAISDVSFAAGEGGDGISASELVELELPYPVELPGCDVKA